MNDDSLLPIKRVGFAWGKEPISGGGTYVPVRRRGFFFALSRRDNRIKDDKATDIAANVVENKSSLLWICGGRTTSRRAPQLNGGEVGFENILFWKQT